MSEGSVQTMKSNDSALKRVFHFFGDHACFVGLVLMVVIATSINPSFLTMTNISNVLRQMSTTSIMALGMATVIICGSIDLCITAFVSIYLAQYSLALAIVGSLAFSTLIGLVNGLIITKMKIHQWITTLSMMLALRGLVLILTDENTYKPDVPNAAFEAIARSDLFVYLNWPIIIMVGFALIIGFFLRYTRHGREIYATGSNLEAARMMGVKTDRTFCLAHMISGFMTGVSGIILASRIGSVSPLAGDGAEMYAIAACVVGGVHLSGGRGKISNVFVGSVIIGLLTNIFNMQSLLSTFWESVITGSLVLIVVLVQSIITMREERKRKVTEAV